MEKSRHGSEYAWGKIRMGASTHWQEYAWERVRMGKSTQGSEYAWGRIRIMGKRLNEQRHFRDEILPIQIIGFGLVTNVRWLSLIYSPRKMLVDFK